MSEAAETVEPSTTLEEIDTIEHQQARATQSLEIADNHVKCQGCGSLKPLIPDSWTLPKSGEIAHRISRLKVTIQNGEKYNNLGDLKKEKQEIAELLKKQEKWLKDPLRRLPLYNTALTGYRWFCNTCYDKADRASRSRRKAV